MEPQGERKARSNRSDDDPSCTSAGTFQQHSTQKQISEQQPKEEGNLAPSTPKRRNSSLSLSPIVNSSPRLEILSPPSLAGRSRSLNQEYCTLRGGSGVDRCIPFKVDIYSEQVTHFKDCHDVLVHIMSYVPDKRQIQLRKLCKNFCQAVDESGAPHRLTQSLYDGILAHNEHIDEKFAPELRARKIYGLGAILMSVLPVVIVMLMLGFLSKLHSIYIGGFVGMGLIGLVTLIPLSISCFYLLRNVPRHTIKFSFVLEILVFVVLLSSFSTAACLGAAEYHYAGRFNQVTTPIIAECPATFSKTTYPEAVTFMHPAQWMMVEHHSSSGGSSGGSGNSDGQRGGYGDGVRVLDTSEGKHENHSAQVQWELPPRAPLATPKPSFPQSSTPSSSPTTLSPVSPTAMKPRYVLKYIGDILPCQMYIAGGDPCVEMPATMNSVTLQMASENINCVHNCSFLTVSPDRGYFDAQPPGFEGKFKLSDWFATKWWQWGKPYVSGKKFPLDTEASFAKFRDYTGLYFLSVIILIIWTGGVYLSLVIKKEGRKVCDFTLPRRLLFKNPAFGPAEGDEEAKESGGAAVYQHHGLEDGGNSSNNPTGDYFAVRNDSIMVRAWVDERSSLLSTPLVKGGGAGRGGGRGGINDSRDSQVFSPSFSSRGLFESNNNSSSIVRQSTVATDAAKKKKKSKAKKPRCYVSGSLVRGLSKPGQEGMPYVLEEKPHLCFWKKYVFKRTPLDSTLAGRLRMAAHAKQFREDRERIMWEQEQEGDLRAGVATPAGSRSRIKY